MLWAKLIFLKDMEYIVKSFQDFHEDQAQNLISVLDIIGIELFLWVKFEFKQTENWFQVKNTVYSDKIISELSTDNHYSSNSHLFRFLHKNAPQLLNSTNKMIHN